MVPKIYFVMPSYVPPPKTEDKEQKAGDNPRVSPLGFLIDRMTDKEIDMASSGLTETQVASKIISVQ